MSAFEHDVVCVGPSARVRGRARHNTAALITALVLFSIAGPTRAVPVAVKNVRHEPVAPRPGVPVLVTAQVAGATSVTLKVQSVAPGKYVRKSDLDYEKDWTDLPMRDDGKEGDAKAGDGVFSLTCARITVQAVYELSNSQRF